MRGQRRFNRCVGAWAATVGLAVALASAAGAVTVRDLYTVTVEPTAETGRQREEIIRLGMEQLLVRVTGRPDAVGHPDLAPLVANAEEYLNSFGSRDVRSYVVGFREAAVTRELAARNWPVWGAERPMTLLWLAVETPAGEQAILSANPDEDELSPALLELMDSARDEIEGAAARLALPVTLPLLDLVDLQAVDFADIWGRYDDRIAAASRRYDADAHLIGLVRAGDFGLEVQWTLVRDDRRRSAVTYTLAEGIRWVATGYAAEYSTVGGVRTTRVLIRDVDSLSALGRVMRYLESLSFLESADIAMLDGTDLTISLKSRGGDDEVLARNLTLGGVLTRSGAAALSPAPPGTLVYELARRGPTR